jgi:exodeoxyribonuclease-1
MLFPLYKARNYPKSLNEDEQKHWEDFRTKRLLDGGANSQTTRFFKRLYELKGQPGLSSEKNYLLEELELYAQNVVPLQEK